MMTHISPSRRRFSMELAALQIAGATIPAVSFAAPATAMPGWHPRYGRKWPVVVVTALKSGTELTNFTIPYGILSAFGVAVTVAVAPSAGDLSMFPALRMRVETTLADFGAPYPEGADHVVIPSMHDRSDATVLAWFREQARNGATPVSICNGAIVLAGRSLNVMRVMEFSRL